MYKYFKYGFSILIFSFIFSCSQEKIPVKKTITFDDSMGLKDISEFPIGSTISVRGIGRDSILDSLHLKNFNSITAGNAMKMYSIARDQEKYNFDAPDRMLEFAQKNNHRLFGHTLIWHSGTPQWVQELAEKNPEALDDFMKDYIQTYVGRYKGKVDGWDVVNEGMNTVGGEYRETMWYNALGKDYIAKAFRYAHEADPDAILFYNDFNIERDTLKLRGVLNMIKDLKSQGVPISGLGFQMHLRMDIPDEIIAYTLKKAAETGLQIHLSEVDIIFNKHDDTRGGGVQIYDEVTDEMLQQQKEKYKNLVLMYRTLIPREQQYGITFWGFADKYSWIDYFFKIDDWPCIYNDSLKPKPAYYGFAEGLQKDLNP